MSNRCLAHGTRRWGFGTAKGSTRYRTYRSPFDTAQAAGGGHLGNAADHTRTRRSNSLCRNRPPKHGYIMRSQPRASRVGVGRRQAFWTHQGGLCPGFRGEAVRHVVHCPGHVVRPCRAVTSRPRLTPCTGGSQHSRARQPSATRTRDSTVAHVPTLVVWVMIAKNKRLFQDFQESTSPTLQPEREAIKTSAFPRGLTG